MPDGSSAESAGESLHEPAPSVHTPEADAPIAQAPTGKQLQRRQLWMWIRNIYKLNGPRVESDANPSICSASAC